MTNMRKLLRPRLALAGVAFGLATLCGVTAAQSPPANDSAPVARIGAAAVHLQDLGPDTAARLASIDQSYTRRLAELELSHRTSTQDTLSSASEDYLNARVLEAEAKAGSTTGAALLDAITGTPVGDAELHSYYDAHEKEIKKPYSEVETQLRAGMESERKQKAQRAYLAGLRAKYDAVVLVEPVRFAVPATGPARGPADAPVTIVLFSDFECPYCKALMPALDQTLDAYPRDVRLVYRNLPLTTLHPHADGAARAAACVEQQHRFWPFLEALFADQHKLTPDGLRETAARVGVDTQRYDNCVASEAPATSLDADAAVAKQLGLASTPVLFINGRMIRGSVRADVIADIVDNEMQRKAAIH